MTGTEARTRRQRLGVSARFVAKRANVSDACIIRFENGKNRPFAKNLHDIDAALTALESEHAKQSA